MNILNMPLTDSTVVLISIVTLYSTGHWIGASVLLLYLIWMISNA